MPSRRVGIGPAVAGALVVALGGGGCGGETAPPGDGGPRRDAGAGFDGGDAAPDPCARRPDGAPCDAEDACILESVCAAGRCRAVRRVQCPIGACMVDNRCDPETGRCAPVPAELGARCDDGDACTTGETCDCAAGAPCQPTCGGGTRIPTTPVPCADGICFTNVTGAAGVDWVADGAPPRGYGAGAVMADLDGDGWLDIVIGSETEPLALYINDRAGGFVERTARSGLRAATSTPAVFQGVTTGDYDGDGDLDLYVTAEGPNRLWRNAGDATFTDVTASSGTGDARWSTGAAFGDMDGDGDLDLAVANYIPSTGSSYPFHTPVANALFENRGDGTFEDVAERLEVGTGPNRGATLVVAFSDFDRDGDVDLLECNDFGRTVAPNQLYLNDGRGGFRPEGARVGFDVAFFCMTVAQSDFDRDLDFDYYHTNIGPHALLSQAPGGFSNVAGRTQTALAFSDCETRKRNVGWGAVFEDFDNDGWQDLFVASGYIAANDDIANPPNQENRLLRNQGVPLPFEDISRSAGIASQARARGVAAGDYDRDGDVDLLVVNLVGPPELYRNDSPAPGHQLAVSLRGRRSNPLAPNAILTAAVDGVTLLREYGVRPSYASASPTEAYFGLGSASRVDALEIAWPSGVRSRRLDVPAPGRLEVVEPLVTVEQVAVSAPAGARFEADVRVHNHGTTPLEVRIELELRGEHGETAAIESARPVVPVGGADVALGFDVPSELPPGPRRWVVSARDDAGGLDQRAVPAD